MTSGRGKASTKGKTGGLRTRVFVARGATSALRCAASPDRLPSSALHCHCAVAPEITPLPSQGSKLAQKLHRWSEDHPQNLEAFRGTVEIITQIMSKNRKSPLRGEGSAHR